MLPKIIHQTWKTRDSLSPAQAHWRASFQQLNPAFEHRLYDDADNAALVAAHAPGLKPIYDSFPKEIYRVDFVRALYLFLSGGFYADLDFQCLQPLDKYLPAEAVIFGRMGTMEEFEHSIPNAMMASPPFDGFWIFYLRHICALQSRVQDWSRTRVEYVTGPVALRAAILAYVQDPAAARAAVLEFLDTHAITFDRAKLCFHPIQLLPAHAWYPIDWNDQLHLMFRNKVIKQNLLFSLDEARQLFPHSDAVTWWMHSW